MCDALVLCGGLGTRLQPVLRDRPKGLAPISGRPFLDILIEELIRHGLRRILLCAGHGADQIVTHFAHRRDAEFVVCVEPKPLGTGGAVRYALPHVHTDPFIVANGDSFCRVNYGDLLRDHASWRPAATIVVTPPNERTDTGTVEVDAEGRITSFAEKLAQANQQRGYVNAGVYVLQRGLIESERPETPVSLERDIFPRAARDSRCRAFHVAGPVIDIGTPERYAAAQALSRW
jgi:NDP-sugar pyrophosphorylase family protein